jgi:transposase
MIFPIHQAYKIPAQSIVSKGKFQLSEQAKKDRLDAATWDQISYMSPVSESSIKRWIQNDMSPDVQTKRKKHPRKNQLLSDEEEEIIIQLAIQQHEAHQTISSSSTKWEAYISM